MGVRLRSGGKCPLWPINLKVVCRLKDGSYRALCPCHEDRVPSVHISVKGNRVLVYCHAGCSTSQILTAWGVTYSDLELLMSGDVPVARTPDHSAGSHGKSKKQRAEIIETYDYEDEDGKLLFQVCRTEPKGFLQRVPDGNGGWTWGTEGVRKVLYRLPRLVRLLAGTCVVVSEGERCVHALEGMGFVATTSAGGASSWRDEYADVLRIHRVAVLYDQDGPGIKYGCSVVRSLRKHTQACMIKIPDLPTKGDVCDFVKAGGTGKELFQIINKQMEEM